jgi:hypothetical protein
MSKRLDLKEYQPVTRTECFDHPHDVAQDYNFILTEALRAQAAEDALRERVRVLEAACTKAQRHIYQHQCPISWDILQEALAGGKGEG